MSTVRFNNAVNKLYYKRLITIKNAMYNGKEILNIESLYMKGY